jgi:ubiquinone/menaquinone biosynthesis C-methylase UbiE
MFQYIFDERLIFPPIENPERILDCGYGSAAWSFDVAEKYPDCQVCSLSCGAKMQTIIPNSEPQVIGIDITPHMKPEEMPRNLWLQVSHR